MRIVFVVVLNQESQLLEVLFSLAVLPKVKYSSKPPLKLIYCIKEELLANEGSLDFETPSEKLVTVSYFQLFLKLDIILSNFCFLEGLLGKFLFCIGCLVLKVRY